MKIDLISRAQLEILNKRGLKYNLQDAQKDYFLALLLKLIYGSRLKSDLVFKGGTAIYHCYLEQLRFSKDLDFTAKRKIAVDDIAELFSDTGVLFIKDAEERKFSMDVLIQYTGVLAQADSIDINININQKVLLEPKILEYKNGYGIKASCLTMDKQEIFAEKIRTLNERSRPRDLYDLAVLREKFGLKVKDGLDLLLKKESHNKLDHERLAENVKISLDRFDDEMEELYYKTVVTKDEVIKLSNEILEALD